MLGMDMSSYGPVSSYFKYTDIHYKIHCSNALKLILCVRVSVCVLVNDVYVSMLLNYCYTTCTEDIEGLEFHKYWSKIRLLWLNKVKVIKVIKVIRL